MNLRSPVETGRGPDTDINNNGVIVTSGGSRLTPNGDGTYTEEIFPGLRAHALNIFGDFVGDTQFHGDTPRTKKKFYDGAFRFTGLGPEEILYQWEPATGNQTVAWDINSAGQVCLKGMTDSNHEEAFLYTNEDGLLNLNDLVTGDLDRWNAAVGLRPFALSEPYVPPNSEDEATGFPLIVLTATGDGVAPAETRLLTPVPVK